MHRRTISSLQSNRENANRREQFNKQKTNADDKKQSNEENEENSANPTNIAAPESKVEDDIYEFKSTPKDSSCSSGDDKSETGKHSDKSSDDKSGTDSDSPNLNLMQLKRPFIDVEKIEESGASTTDDETKRKKRKETDNVTKENKSTAAGNRNLSRQDKTQSKTANLTNKSLWNLEGKSPTPSPKPPKLQESDAEVDDPSKSSTDDGPKVPPLKIVIPQQTSTADQEVGGNVKTNKNTSNRNQNALPYVLVASENSGEKETSASTGSLSPDFTKDKESAKNSEERAQQRVLRSALRAQGGSVSNNSSPQNSASPSPSFVAVCDTNSQMGGSTNAGDDSASAQVGNNAASGNSTEETASANNNNNNQSSNSNSGVNSNTGNSVNSGNNETNNQAAATSNTTNQSASNQNNENDNAAQGNNNASDTSNNNNSAAPGNSGANKEQATNQLSNTNQNSNSASINAEKNSNTNGDNSGNQTSNATSSDSDGNSSNKNGSSSGSAQSTTGTTAQQPASDNETRNTSSPANQSAFIPSNDLHPRKRKIKTNKESSVSTPAQPEEKSDASNADVPPTEQPYNNCYQMFLNIRKQIDRKHRNLVPIAPKPPEGFKDYLMNTRNYMLAGKTSSELDMISMPADIPEEMKTLFISQEKERHKLKLQHIVEKEKLVLSVEQEIVRVHCKTARTLSNQTQPYSVATVLKDQEVYKIVEDKDQSSRGAPRCNRRLFLSWLQDVDDKWEKIKEAMILRHHNESESLHAVQKMDWEFKLKEVSLCDYKSKPIIEEKYVPMVDVSDDFALPLD